MKIQNIGLLSEGLPDGWNLALWIIAFVSLTLLLIVRIENAYTVLSSRKRRQIRKLESALSSGHIDEKIKPLLKEELTKEYFFLTHKVRCEKESREYLIAEHESCNGKFPFKLYCYAYRFMKNDTDIQSIHISKSDWFIHYILGRYFGFCLLLLGYLMSVGGFAIVLFSDKQAGLTALIAGLFFFSISFAIINQSIPWSAAKRIKEYVTEVSEANKEAKTSD